MNENSVNFLWRSIIGEFDMRISSKYAYEDTVPKCAYNRGLLCTG